MAPSPGKLGSSGPSYASGTNRSLNVQVRVPLKSPAQPPEPPMPPPPSRIEQRDPNKRQRSPTSDDIFSQHESQVSQSRSSSSKRPKTATSARFSESTKSKIRALSSQQDCWHCGADGRDVAHVIPKRFKDLENLLRFGMVNISALNDKDNGIPLCPNCHHKYDDNDVPYWIFYPEDLDFFLATERREMQRRKRKWRYHRRLVARNSPTAQAYRDHQEAGGNILAGQQWGTYRIFIVKEFRTSGHADHIIRQGPSGLKAWHGDPMAALHHAFKAFSYPAGLPSQFRELANMYVDNDDELRRLESQKQAPNDVRDNEDDDDDQDDDNDPGDGRRTGNYGLGSAPRGDGRHGGQKQISNSASKPSQRQSKRVENRGKAHVLQRTVFVPRDELLYMLSPRSSSRKPKPMLQDEFTRPFLIKRPRIYEEERDPEADTTAQDRIDFFNFFNGGGYVDNGPWNTNYKTKNTEYGLPSPRDSDETERPSGPVVLESTTDVSHAGAPAVDFNEAS